MKQLMILSTAVLVAGCQQPAENSATASTAAQTAEPSNDAEQIADFWKEVASVHFTEDRSHAGTTLPTAPLTTSTGATRTLASFRGKPVLVNFWAHWCVPCRAEMPTINALAKQRGDRLAVVTINEDIVQPTSKSLGALAIAPVVQELSDPKGDLAKTYAGKGLPTTVLFGADGRERWRLVGVLDWTKQQAQALVNEAS